MIILMEMYHLGNKNWNWQWDRIDINYKDWNKMDTHFKEIRQRFFKMEFVTISDAVKIYLDRYTPDIIALRTNEKIITNRIYNYDIEMIGSDIEASLLRPHYVYIKPPIYFLKIIERVELIHNGSIQ